MSDGRQVSEDIYFSRKANDLGIRPVAHPQVICNHFKMINLTALMRARMNHASDKQKE